jgi:hypothetical protein
MYNDVSFSIRLANGITQPFQTSIGVKQGCVLTPTFFSVYMNDLVEHFNLECDPVSINEKSISCLLYADDIVLMSQSANGLQTILDNLKLFCDKWNLKVNIQKTKVMIFNKSGKVLKGYTFSFEEQFLELVSEYKYLIIVFKPSGSFSFAIHYLSKKASIKAMFCIRKTLYSEKLNAFLHLRLFDACVKPILLYCSEIWSLDILIKRN